MKSKIKRTEKKKEKFRKAFHRQKELHSLLREYGGDILDSDNFRKTDEYIQHGNMTVNHHCINVAKYSLAISQKLKIRCNRRELIRGALLHDYFLYDWHDKHRENMKRLHGFYHPGIALKNAAEEYELTAREKDIIRKHMWPLTVIPPQYREAWIVTTADKYCSLLETIHFHKGRGKKRQFSQDIQLKQQPVKVQYQG